MKYELISTINTRSYSGALHKASKTGASTPDCVRLNCRRLSCRARHLPPRYNATTAPATPRYEQCFERPRHQGCVMCFQHKTITLIILSFMHWFFTLIANWYTYRRKWSNDENILWNPWILLVIVNFKPNLKHIVLVNIYKLCLLLKKNIKKNKSWIWNVQLHNVRWYIFFLTNFST